MSYQIEISPAARQESAPFPVMCVPRLSNSWMNLAENPRLARAKQLRERENIFRIWLADLWRIVYAVDDEVVTVLVLRVRRKEDVDYPSI